ncbi:MAG: hypothetical protein HC936_13275 [Leptolyngbyaceae cyanobacterium SU_3_3]|nr:hypothetical protein [Leptolyngbyaceae cyanobacterium SU_3_3]
MNFKEPLPRQITAFLLFPRSLWANLPPFFNFNVNGGKRFSFEPELTSKSRFKSTEVSEFPRTPLIEIAALELAPQSLSQSLIEFAQKANRQGFNQIKVVPLFLAPGVHVQSDIPGEIALGMKQLDNQVTLQLSPYLGKYSGIVALLSSLFGELSGKHGS